MRQLPLKKIPSSLYNSIRVLFLNLLEKLVFSKSQIYILFRASLKQSKTTCNEWKGNPQLIQVFTNVQYLLILLYLNTSRDCPKSHCIQFKIDIVYVFFE